MMIIQTYNMKKFICLLFVIGFIYGCGAGSNSIGEINRGTKGKTSRTQEAPPYGMSYIPAGSFLMGSNDQDILFAANSGTRMITVDAFWMDQTEITNFEYRQFVNYVKDSILRRIIAETNPEFLVEGDPMDDQGAQPALNWKAKINMKDENVRAAMNSMNYQGSEALFNKREVDVRKLAYEQAWIDYQQAAKVRYDYKEKKYVGTVKDATGQTQEVQDRGSFIIRDMTMVYPDTLCWIRDYAFSYNEPFALRYFSHPSYNDYPVVGITWQQANAFCKWRTKLMENARKANVGHEYRLPTELEWEYAARGGIQAGLYPWGGPYTTESTGCYLANFKPQRGRYELDGGVRTLPVASYHPNDYGLYDMAGNVAEWTLNAFDENTYSFYHDMMPTFDYNALENDADVLKRKVIRGGSWKDIAYYLQCGTRTFEYQDSARSYIGFRCVRSYVGTK